MVFYTAISSSEGAIFYRPGMPGSDVMQAERMIATEGIFQQQR